MRAEVDPPRTFMCACTHLAVGDAVLISGQRQQQSAISGQQTRFEPLPTVSFRDTVHTRTHTHTHTQNKAHMHTQHAQANTQLNWGREKQGGGVLFYLGHISDHYLYIFLPSPPRLFTGLM